MKKYSYQGSTFVFNQNEFINAFNFVAKDKDINIRELEEELANALCVSSNTVHGWRFTENSPVDIEIIKNLAMYFNKPLDIFLKELKATENKEVESNMTKEVTESLKRIYDAIIEYLFEFSSSDGFNNYWFEFPNDKSTESLIFEKVNNEIHSKVRLAYEKEYFYLHGLKIYEDLGNYIGETLYDIFDQKISYAYRFECDGITSNTTDQDYEAALDELHKILNI